MNKIALFCALIALAGCATPPKQYQFENERTVKLGKDAAWSNLMEWFTSNQIQIKTVEKDSGIIYAERSYVNIPDAAANLADCGKLGETPIHPTTVGLNVFMRATDRHSTKVTVNANYTSWYLNAWNNQITNVQCTSRGGLEGDILRAVSGE